MTEVVTRLCTYAHHTYSRMRTMRTHSHTHTLTQPYTQILPGLWYRLFNPALYVIVVMTKAVTNVYTHPQILINWKYVGTYTQCFVVFFYSYTQTNPQRHTILTGLWYRLFNPALYVIVVMTEAVTRWERWLFLMLHILERITATVVGRQLAATIAAVY
jgi:hypothetical protein